MEMTDLTNAQKLDLILNQRAKTPEKTAAKLPSIGQKNRLKATKVDDYMNRFNKSVE